MTLIQFERKYFLFYDWGKIFLSLSLNMNKEVYFPSGFRQSPVTIKEDILRPKWTHTEEG